MSPHSLPSEFHDAVLTFVWRQWGQLGVAASAGGNDPWCIDPEALLLFSMDVLRHDPRMFDEVLDWLETQGGRLIRQRITNMSQAMPAETARVVEAAIARTQHATGARRSSEATSPLVPLFHGLPIEATRFGKPDLCFARFGFLRPEFEPSGKTVTPPLLASASFPFRLRELFGAGSRSEALRFLLLIPGNEAGTKDVADAVTLGRQNVHRALEGLAAAGVCTRLTRGNRDVWVLPRRRWLDWLELPADALPTWVHWPRAFTAISELRRWLLSPERDQESTYIRASRARKLMKAIIPAIAESGLPWRPSPPELFPGEAYAVAFEADMQRLAAILRGDSEDAASRGGMGS